MTTKQRHRRDASSAARAAERFRDPPSGSTATKVAGASLTTANGTDALTADPAQEGSGADG